MALKDLKSAGVVPLYETNDKPDAVTYRPVSILSGVCINGRDVQRKKCCKQCGQVKFMGTMTKWSVQKHTEHHKTRSIQRRNRH